MVQQVHRPAGPAGPSSVLYLAEEVVTSFTNASIADVINLDTELLSRMFVKGHIVIDPVGSNTINLVNANTGVIYQTINASTRCILDYRELFPTIVRIEGNGTLTFSYNYIS